jgi:hypothetical protein
MAARRSPRWSSPRTRRPLSAAILLEEHLSELLIFDTEDISSGPTAIVKVPFQMGWSAHGHYLDFDHGEHIVKKYKENPIQYTR